MAQYRARLEVVELDARVLPSVTGASVLLHLPGNPSGAVHTAVNPVQPHSISGSGAGTVRVAPSLFGGPSYSLVGSGTFGSLGLATITGSVRFPPAGLATGTIRLASASGTVTLQLSGAGSRFTYTITSATGTGVGVASTGTLTLALNPVVRVFSLSI